MKRLMTLALGLAFVFGTVGISKAQEPPKKEKSKKKSSKKASKKKAEEKK